MNDELRERLAQVSWEAADGYVTGIPWDSEYVKDNVFKGGKERRRVDAILAEIEQAGYRIVQADRWEKLERLVRAEDAMWTHDADCDGMDAAACQPYGIELVEARDAIDWIPKPGDLDGDV